jgi:hypothetical protein
MKVNNWSSLQSYKDRKPPWIRLHKTLLDNFEFHSMSKNARALLPMLWLLASEDKDPTSGIIPYTLEQISFRLRMTKKDLESGLAECIAAEFIQQNQSCSESVTKPLQCRNSTVPPETETETDLVQFESFWTAFADKRSRSQALNSWKKIKPNDELATAIIHGAEQYAKQRVNIIARNGTPKMAQGWLTDKRWEDEDVAAGEELTPQQKQAQKTGGAVY